MKKSLFLIVAMVMVASFGYSQNYFVVNTEKIFKAVPAYVKAQESLDGFAKSYQKTIDDAYVELEKMYDTYQGEKSRLSEFLRQQREDAIITREKEIQKFQQDVFGQDGDLMKKRVELVKPIQDKVFKIINDFATSTNAGLVIDIATNPTVLFYAPSVDKTEEIIKLINKK